MRTNRLTVKPFLARMVVSYVLPSLIGFLPCCDQGGQKKATQADSLIVYCSIDERFGRMVLDEYSKRHAVELLPVFDSEAGKTTGLVNRIIHEAKAGRPRADVLWSSELFNTIKLARLGLLEPYDSPSAADIPDRFKDPRHRWTATSVRGRVIAFDPARIPKSLLPTHWKDLAKPRIAKHVVIANPLFGTTRGHISAMFALWGPEQGRAFLKSLRESGALVVDGNSAAVRAILAGRRMIAVTDTDDVWVAQRHGASLELMYLDMGDGGTLLIPCSVALIKGAPHGTAARNLVDFLVSAEVERMLAESDSRNVPVREGLRRKLNMTLPLETKVRFDAIVDAMDEAVAAARELLLR